MHPTIPDEIEADDDEIFIKVGGIRTTIKKEQYEFHV